jgi:predicted HTH transcriptional regulator
MSTFKFNQGTMSNEELDKLTKFWNKKQFRTWSKAELERSSKNMQALLAALKETTASELASILKMNSYGIMKYPDKSKEYIIWTANKKDLEYALSISPKTFKVKQG